MKSAVETLSPTRVRLTVEVPYEELKPSVDAAYKSIGSQIQVPGFRRGKVPARIIEQRVGRAAVLQEAVNESLPDFYGQGLAEHDLRPLSQPEVEVTAVPVVEGEEFVFSAELDVRPTIEVPDFSEITVSVDTVDDAAVEIATDERIADLQQRFGTLVGVERAAGEGDFVTIDLRGVIDGEEIDAVQGVSYEVGSGTMINGLDDALTGLSAGESATFTAPLAGGEHAGEDSEITVSVTAVKERELPELDDDFAQEASEFETMAELRESMRGQARRMKSFEQGVQARDKVLEHLLDSLEIPVPESIIEAQVHEHLSSEDRLEDDEHRAEVGDEARRSLRTQLLLDVIADEEEVEVTQQELVEYLLMSAQQYGMDPADFARAMDDGQQMAAMAGEVARRKALATVLERVKVTDAEGNVIDLNAALDDDEDAEEGEDAGEDAVTEASAEAAEDASTPEPAQDEASAEEDEN